VYPQPREKKKYSQQYRKSKPEAQFVPALPPKQTTIRVCEIDDQPLLGELKKLAFYLSPGNYFFVVWLLMLLECSFSVSPGSGTCLSAT